MRGYPRFNFDRFEAAMLDLQELGYEVISPHRMDLDLGFDPDRSLEDNVFDVEDAVRRDVEAIIRADAIVLLEGSDKSTGATAERWIAKWLGRPVIPISELCQDKNSLLERSETAA